MHDTKNNTNGNCIVRPVLLDAPAGKHHGERKAKSKTSGLLECMGLAAEIRRITLNAMTSVASPSRP
ncbi:hypothetical protein LSAT2_024332 [Lamellibrachia satsuma]|nr:hypothetical protein LSAT2_024332 [Lamellibrachia satsuma]